MTDAEKFTSELRRYIDRNHVPGTTMGRMVNNDPSFVGQVLNHARNPRKRVRDIYREFMKANPNGLPNIKKRNRRHVTPRIYSHIGRTGNDYQPIIPPEKQVNREPCPKCGVRGEMGCKHRAKFDPPPILGMRNG